MKSKPVDYNKELEDLLNNLHEDKASAQNSSNLNFSELQDNSEYVSYDKRGFIGRNTNLVYRNKYVSTGKRLATTEVVDISEFGAKAKPAPEKQPEVKPIIDYSESEELKPEEKSSVDDLFSFFDEEDDKIDLADEVQDEPKEEKKSPVAAKPRKKKRALDIDIISGGQGGDII